MMNVQNKVNTPGKIRTMDGLHWSSEIFSHKPPMRANSGHPSFPAKGTEGSSNVHRRPLVAGPVSGSASQSYHGTLHLTAQGHKTSLVNSLQSGLEWLP